MPSCLRAFCSEHERIVRHRPKLALDDSPRKGNGIKSRSQYLWRAAQRIRVLHPRVIVQMRRHDLAAVDQRRQPRRHLDLAPLPPGFVNARVEKGIGPAAGVDAHGGGAKGGREEAVDVRQG